MKKRRLLLFAISICLIGQSTFAQNYNVEMIQLGWSFVSPVILKKVSDPLTKEIIIKTIPKIIDQDSKGAVLEISDAIYKVKNIKVLNKDFLLLIEKNINTGIKTIKQKDYASAVNELVKVAVITEAYINSGSLGKTESTNPVKVDSEKSDIITANEIDGILHIGMNNNYLFFMTDGSFSKVVEKNSDKNDNSKIENFNVSLNDGKKFNISIDETPLSQLEQTSIDMIQADKTASDNFKNKISENLASNLGEGQIIKSEIATCPNFKALKYTYLYTDKISSASSMAYVLAVFQDPTMFLISFNTPANDFLVTSKSFDDLMKTFFIIGVDEISDNKNTNLKKKPVEEKPDCETNNQGVLTIVNKSTNPYLIYKNGNYLMTINGKEVIENIYVDLGTTNFKAEQKSGFLMYPTVNKRPVEFKTACQNITINIGFED